MLSVHLNLRAGALTGGLFWAYKHAFAIESALPALVTVMEELHFFKLFTANTSGITNKLGT